jgi:hypothetical protein
MEEQFGNNYQDLKCQKGVEVHSCNPSAWEAEAGGW